MTQKPENPFEIATSAKLSLAGSCQFGVNDARTCGKSGTWLTQPCSLPVHPAPGPYECGVGQPPMNCNVCGGRVPDERCNRHPREPGYIALRDKYSRLFVIRTDSPTPTRKTPDRFASIAGGRL